MKMITPKKKWKKALIITLLTTIVYIIIWYLVNTYQNIEIKQSNYETTKVQSTNYSEKVENIEQESKSLADVIEDVTKSVVGISKLKSTGSSILGNSDEESLGLGTGVIVTKNRLYT